ncbi:hypothetical protein [Actinomadura montaniterrae]|uniref:Uncharacterized protein n=1 Tax=Actinomadura montaniterrae TaxID=1803903 RepID=A0A6L3VVA0_9ACTN|nr:hypothetical protein [Actinomadura montaniterrae]KAB2382834.1 hypothetical protein F9B16_13275 [Actinomadura montaniterrae]
MTPTAPAHPVPPTRGGPPEKIAMPVLPSAVPAQPGDLLVYSAVQAGRHQPRPSGDPEGLGVLP